MKNIVIIGSGAYGTALASVLIENNHNVTILGIEKSEIDDININHQNSKYFSDVKLDKRIKASLDWEETFKTADTLVLAVPSQFIGDICQKINKFAVNKMGIINVSKGFCEKDVKIPFDVLSDKLHPQSYDYIGGIYGPSIASEVIGKKYVSIAAASENMQISKKIEKIFKTDYFAVYSSDSIQLIEYAVILKNVFAIVTGMSSSIFDSRSTVASFVAIAISEIKKIISVYKNTSVKNVSFDIASLADIILTTTSSKSRNFSLGYKIGEVDNVSEVLKTFPATVEGLNSCKLVYSDLLNRNINFPLLSTLYDILFNKKKPSTYLISVFSKFSN